MRIDDNGNLILNKFDVLEGIPKVEKLEDFRNEVYIAGRYAVMAGFEVRYETLGVDFVIAKPKRKE